MPALHPLDEQLYTRIAQIARESLEIVNRTANLETKLKRLDLAEQNMRDLLWLAPENNTESLNALLEQIEQERPDIIKKFALPEVRHQIERAEKTKSGSIRMSALTKAGIFITYCIDEVGDSEELHQLAERLTLLGGEAVSRERPEPLNSIHTKRTPPGGCSTALLALVLGLLHPSKP